MRSKRHLRKSQSHQALYLQFINAIKASGNAEARKEAQRLQELTEKHVEEYVAQITMPTTHITNSLISVLLRLKEEACGEELSLMNSSRLDGLRSLGLVRKAEVLTDDGNTVPSASGHSVLRTEYADSTLQDGVQYARISSLKWKNTALHVSGTSGSLWFTKGS